MRAWISIVAFLLGIYTSISLASYHSYDPTFSKAFYPYVASEIQNSGGLLGANLADFLIQLMGVSSWLVPFAIGMFLYRLLVAAAIPDDGGVEIPRRKIGRKLLAIPLLFYTQAAFIGSAFVLDPMYPSETPPGGVLGESSAYWSLLYLGETGALLVNGLLFIVCFCILMDISFIQVLQSVPHKVQSVVAAFTQSRKTALGKARQAEEQPERSPRFRSNAIIELSRELKRTPGESFNPVSSEQPSPEGSAEAGKGN